MPKVIALFSIVGILAAAAGAVGASAVSKAESVAPVAGVTSQSSETPASSAFNDEPLSGSAFSESSKPAPAASLDTEKPKEVESIKITPQSSIGGSFSEYADDEDEEEAAPAPQPAPAPVVKSEPQSPVFLPQEDTKSAAEKKLEGPKNLVIPSREPAKSFYAGEGMLVNQWESDGVIIGDKDKKMLISAGDTVYVNIGKDKVKPGTQCYVYRKVGSVNNPHKKAEVMGFEVRRAGKLEITQDIGDKTSTAKVLISNEPIEIGDAVKVIR